MKNLKIKLMISVAILTMILSGCIVNNKTLLLNEQQVIDSLKQVNLKFYKVKLIESKNREIQGYLENKNEKLTIVVYNSAKDAENAKKTKDELIKNLDGVFAHRFYVKNIEIKYFNDDIARNKPGKFDTKIKNALNSLK